MELPHAHHEEPVPQPTAGDVENAAIRQAIAARQEAEYAQCLKLALGALGPVWTPWMKLILVESDYHRRRDQPFVIGATVYKVYRGEYRLTENSRYLIQDADGTVRHAANYEPLFGELLREKHPSYGFERNGKWIAFDRWSVTWSAIELYTPKCAEELAALRVSRERNKVEREARAWAEAHPLLIWAGINPEDAKTQGE